MQVLSDFWSFDIPSVHLEQPKFDFANVQVHLSFCMWKTFDVLSSKRKSVVIYPFRPLAASHRIIPSRCNAECPHTICWQALSGLVESQDRIPVMIDRISWLLGVNSWGQKMRIRNKTCAVKPSHRNLPVQALAAQTSTASTPPEALSNSFKTKRPYYVPAIRFGIRRRIPSGSLWLHLLWCKAFLQHQGRSYAFSKRLQHMATGVARGPAT